MDTQNFIIAEIDIKEENINKDIRILNSYEEWKKKNTIYISDNKTENDEMEFKANCEIMINDKVIPFSYFHAFNQPGKYKITYKFKTNLKKQILCSVNVA